MASGRIPRDSITASSSLVGHEPWLARLGFGNTAWCGSKSEHNMEWLAIDLGEIYIITSISVSGDTRTKSWVKTFILHYKQDYNSQWIGWRTVLGNIAVSIHYVF